MAKITKQTHCICCDKETTNVICDKCEENKIMRDGKKERIKAIEKIIRVSKKKYEKVSGEFWNSDGEQYYVATEIEASITINPKELHKAMQQGIKDVSEQKAFQIGDIMVRQEELIRDNPDIITIEVKDD
jgi:hypothetical protein